MIIANFGVERLHDFFWTFGGSGLRIILCSRFMEALNLLRVRSPGIAHAGTSSLSSSMSVVTQSPEALKPKTPQPALQESKEFVEFKREAKLRTAHELRSPRSQTRIYSYCEVRVLGLLGFEALTEGFESTCPN